MERWSLITASQPVHQPWPPCDSKCQQARSLPTSAISTQNYIHRLNIILNGPEKLKIVYKHRYMGQNWPPRGFCYEGQWGWPLDINREGYTDIFPFCTYVLCVVYIENALAMWLCLRRTMLWQPKMTYKVSLVQYQISTTQWWGKNILVLHEDSLLTSFTFIWFKI